MREPAAPQFQLTPELGSAVCAAAGEWTAKHNTKRLWDKDATLWRSRDEAKWLGWLDIAKEGLANMAPLADMADTAKGFRHVVVLGMGGSSLCPDVLSRTFGHIAGHPELRILDSTDPAQVRRVEAALDLAKTLFIVASKSGSTLEPNIFFQHFFERVRGVLGAEAGSRFIAVTDPGSKVEASAKSAGFRRVLFGVPSIGGRYSALSNFGMAPAAAMGLDVKDFLTRAQAMADACREPDATKNPGTSLGVALGLLANMGRDKLTIVASPAIASFGAWLEQLVAESTGKEGKAIVPIDGESVGAPGVYGKDRVFAYARLATAPSAEQDAALAKLAAAGHPVIRIDVADTMDLGAEFFRWEIATAVAGSLLRINPFDQPDVEASKIETKKLTSAYEAQGSLPPETPLVTGHGFSLFTDADNAESLLKTSGGARSVTSIVATHLSRLVAGDYFGLLLYVDMNPANEALAQSIREMVRNRRRVATCVGFGPRFLHSTGQAYKGGPPSGVFLQVTCDDADDLPVPGARYTFGVVKSAQARGDFAVLAERGRRALRVHLGKDVTQGLTQLRDLVASAIA